MLQSVSSASSAHSRQDEVLPHGGPQSSNALSIASPPEARQDKDVDTPRSSRGIQMLKRWILTRMKKKNEARLYMSLMESLDSRISLPSMSPVPSHQQERMTGKRELRRWL